MEIVPKMNIALDQMEFQSLAEALIVACESGEMSVQGQAFVESFLTAINVEILSEDDDDDEEEEGEEGEETVPADTVKH